MDEARTVKLLRSILDTIADPVFVKDNDHKFVFVNAALCAFVGLDRDSMLGKDDHAFFPKEQADVFYAKDRQVFEETKTNVNDELLVGADGTDRSIRTTKAVFEDDELGAHLVGIISDRTDFHGVQTELTREKHLLSKILNSLPLLVWWCDGDGGMLGSNVQPSTREAFTSLRRTEAQRAVEAAVLSSGGRHTHEQRVQVDGAEEIWDCTVVPLLVRGSIDGVLTLARDQTELETRRRAEMRAEESNRAKSRFLTNMSHELRTPLNGIIGYAELIEEDLASGDPDRAREFVRPVLTAAHQLLGMIDDVLDLSRIEDGHDALQPETLSSSAVIDAVVEAMRPFLQERSVRVVSDGACTFTSDRRSVVRVLSNLLSNAAKYAPGTEVRIEVRRDSAGVRFGVHDSGVGIAPENLERVFEKFWQADGAGDRDVPGTGLGLAISKQLAKQLGGDLRVESTVGRGTVFWLDLPSAP